MQKGNKKRYIHLNAEFQRIARDKKAFLSDQCKEIEENKRMGKTRDLFKKIRDTKGKFSCKDGHNALGRPRGNGWRGRFEGGSGWGTHVNPWLFHFNV